MQFALKSYSQGISNHGKALQDRDLMRPDFFRAEFMMSRFI